MGKQANNLVKLSAITHLKCLFTIALFIGYQTVKAQNINYEKGKKYTIEEISVLGNTTFSEQTIITYSGLRKGSEITIPGKDIAKAIKKLWNSNLFSDIEVYVTKIEGSKAHLQIQLSDLPQLNEVKINGVKKGKIEGIINDNKLKRGVKVTENLITTTKNHLIKKYKKDGFYNTKVHINTIDVKDSIQTARVNMVINIDKGEKVKIKDIVFSGNEILSDKRLRKAMKSTKKINRLRIFKRSKYVDSAYQADLGHIVDAYKENGYRDARILSDSLTVNNDKTISLFIDVKEGEKYTFGDIKFIGNTVYSDEFLHRLLRIKKGDTYNGVLLQERIADPKPDALDITNQYQNNGYLFSTINPVEVSADNNVIDMEIRISEGKPAYFNSVSVVGNDKTNDHVIYRELRTRPGQLYSKANVVRTVRELGQLGFFDAQEITPNFNNANPVEGTIDMEYVVKETGSSQIELQGGYGGGGFIGTLGLSFNNFSIKDIFKKEAYKPIPMGDGQKLALRLQASSYYQTYSFSFSEPWWGGKRPVQFSTSLSHTKQFLYDYTTGDADKSRSFNITGITFGLAKRLTVPDDYFTLSQAISFQRYDLNNYNTGLFTFGDGYSNNLSYTIGLSRNNTSVDPIFPTGGSKFSVTAKLTLPYSLFNGVDYEALSEEYDKALEKRSSAESTSDLDYISANEEITEIDQERYKWLEFYKVTFKGEWYTELAKNLVLRPLAEFGFLGAYNNDRGVIPFERYYLGGDGLGTYSLDGREAIQLRGYPNQSLTPLDESTGSASNDGGTIYNKFSLELRYPITLKSSAKIYALAFLEGGVSYNSFRDFNPFAIKRSSGVGLRIFMPAFGLLGIDFGYGFDPLPGETTKNGWETHFIIGQQF